MHKAEIIGRFDPNGVGLRNGRFIGLPFDAENAEVLLLPVPWDVTVSSSAGTAGGPENILEASSQLDLYDPDVEDAWKLGIFFHLESKIFINNRFYTGQRYSVSYNFTPVDCWLIVLAFSLQTCRNILSRSGGRFHDEVQKL